MGKKSVERMEREQDQQKKEDRLFNRDMLLGVKIRILYAKWHCFMFDTVQRPADDVMINENKWNGWGERRRCVWEWERERVCWLDGCCDVYTWGNMQNIN